MPCIHLYIDICIHIYSICLCTYILTVHISCQSMKRIVESHRCILPQDIQLDSGSRKSLVQSKQFVLSHKLCTFLQTSSVIVAGVYVLSLRQLVFPSYASKNQAERYQIALWRCSFNNFLRFFADTKCSDLRFKSLSFSWASEAILWIPLQDVPMAEETALSSPCEELFWQSWDPPFLPHLPYLTG